MVLSSTNPEDHRKQCTLCQRPRDVLIRCQIDDTGTWHFACPQKCWKDVSGGVVDGDDSHPFYRYGGVWKNKVGGVSGRKPKAKGKTKAEKGEWEVGGKYTRNDRVFWREGMWVCRQSHVAREGEEPGLKVGFWKEDDTIVARECEEGEGEKEDEGKGGQTGDESASESASASG